MSWQPAGLNVCFVDYLYPLMCKNAWAIVGIIQTAFSTNTTAVGAVCLNSGDVNGVEIDLGDNRVKSCIAFVGLETSARLSQVDEFIIGPSYNYSSDVVFPFESSRSHNGWAFLSAFSWGVWIAILGVVGVTLVVQFTMRLLKTDTSPVLSRENTAEIISRSMLSTVGTSRLYDRSVMPRHILSCVLAVFAVVITCLYGSNLVNSFYSMNAVFQEPTSIHPALRDMAHRGVTTLDAIPNGVFEGTPVVSRVIAKHFNDTFKLATFVEKPVLYQVYIVKSLVADNIYDILEDVRYRIREHQRIDVRALFEKGDAVFKLTLADTWGLFVFLVFGYVISIATRVLFTNKKGLCARYTSSGRSSPEPSAGFLTPVGGSPDKIVIPDNSYKYNSNTSKTPEIVVENSLDELNTQNNTPLPASLDEIVIEISSDETKRVTENNSFCEEENIGGLTHSDSLEFFDSPGAN